MTGAWPSPLAAKEVRALAPVWVAAAVAMTAAAAAAGANVPAVRASVFVTALSGSLMHVVAVAAYVLGATALGALSIGHEYTHRTMGTLLAQPVDRRRILVVKRGVLAALLAALATMGWGLLLWSGADVTLDAVGGRTGWWGRSLLVLPILWALGVAPWLTLICRNATAGLVFTMAVPAACWLLAGVIIFVRQGMTQTAWEAGEALTLATLWIGVATLSLAGFVAAGRLFARAESLDGPAIDLSIRPASKQIDTAASAAPRVHRPLRLLIGKELRLQTWLPAMALKYVLVWAAVSLWRPEPDLVAPLLASGTALYAALIAMFAGSLASAEERGLGTLEWQTLLPYAAWKAWAVKVATALGLVLLLAVALPAGLSLVGPVAGEWRPVATPGLAPSVLWTSVPGLFAYLIGTSIVAASLHISSLCTSGLRALLLSLPIVTIGGLLSVTITAMVARDLWWRLDINTLFQVNRFGVIDFRNIDQWRAVAAAMEGSIQTAHWLSGAIALACVAGFVAALLWLAYRNHHAARGDDLPWRQIAALAVLLVAGSVLAGAASPVLLTLLLSP